MSILTPFRWAGAKNKLLPNIMEYLNPILANNTNFCEPFVGGACVALQVAKSYPAMQIHMADKDFGLASFWKIVSNNDNAQLLSMLKMMEARPTLDLFYKLKETITDDPIIMAYRVLFLNRTAFSGIISSGPIGGKDQKSKWKIDCRYNYSKLKTKILNCHSILKNRTIVECCDFRNFEPLKSNNYAAYIDPPYVKAGSILYDHFMLEQDHKDLAQLLIDKDKWVLSYDDHPLIRELYKNCNIFDINAKYSIDGVKTTLKNKIEILILPK